MSLSLDRLTPCFQGLIPATFYTCSRDGIPNVAYLSHVEYVDSQHVALSFQFFNKSRKNIDENPQALVRVFDPDTLQGYDLRLRYVRSESAGPLFESMDLRIEAIASHTGMKGVFKLRAADVYEVLSIGPVEAEAGIAAPCPSARNAAARAGDALFTMRALQVLSDRINRAATLEELLESTLAALEDLLGFSHAMILLAGERNGKLVTIASRGYADSGVGAEVGFGEGIIGMVAEARKPIRISGLLRGMLYAYAVRQRAHEAGVCPNVRQIPLPGLQNPASQLGIPLLVRGELLGVLCIESEEAYRFHEEDRAYAEVLGSYIAIAIQNQLLQERAEDAAANAPAPERGERAGRGSGGERDERGARGATADDKAADRPRREATYYRSDECILVDGEYLIRSLPAKILWKILREHVQDGRSQFTNRELRLDKTLQLPEYKDNLESRLILLRKRLEQKCPDIRLQPCARGRFRLDLRCHVVLGEKP